MINVLYAGNYKVVDGIMLSIMSMTKYFKEPINVFIMTADVTELNPDFRPIDKQAVISIDNYLKSINPESKANLIMLGKDFNEWITNSENRLNTYTPFAFLRLFADRVEELPDKVVYLDVDVMFNGDISELYDYDITNYELGVVKDRYGCHFIKPRYFNSGVLLMNLNKIRETKLLSRVVEMCTYKEMAFPDQSALNKLCKYKVYLPRRFNEQGNVREDTVIQHFSKRIKWLPFFHTQNVKPWQIDEVHNKYKWHHYDDIYDEFLKLKK